MKPAKLTKTLALALLALAACVAQNRALAGGDDRKPEILPPHSHAYGKSLTEWLETYWRWYYTGADPVQSKVGRVQLMPLPNGEYISGSGTPADPALYRGQLEVTLLAGTPFVLPEFAWVWERYNNGTPDDVPMNDSVALRGAHPVLTIDGRIVLSDANKAAYYVPDTAFVPIVVYPAPTSYGSIAALSFQSLGVVGEPLSVGRHVIHLYEPEIFHPGDTPVFPDGYGVIFDNTWVVTVLPEDLGNPRIAPPNSEPFGKTYGEWAAAWWQWAASVPADVNPVVDETGADASEGQRGPVWFLAGVFNATGTAERTVTLPPGKALFFPIVNYSWVSTLPTDPTTADTIRPLIEPAVDAATDLACEIDGEAVRNLGQYRTESPLFDVTVPGNNIFGLDPGTYGPSLDEGYYLMLAPLNAGRHSIHFHGSLPTIPFTLDITYHITVRR